MTLLEAILVLLAGVGAGTINAVVGSGTLITFPTLLAIGIPPVTANMSNNIGLVPGSVAGAVGYRRELEGQRALVMRLAGCSLVGSVVGAVLLLVLPPDAFEAVVPVLIGLGVVLVIVQPRLSAWVSGHHPDTEPVRDGRMQWWVPVAVLATGVYGGYFGAAQGVLLMGVLGIGVAETMQRLNGVKNVLATIVNAAAGLLFVAVASTGLLGSDARIDWLVVALIAAGATVGGFLGASIGRRLPALALRAVIVVVGLTAIAVIVAR